MTNHLKDVDQIIDAVSLIGEEEDQRGRFRDQKRSVIDLGAKKIFLDILDEKLTRIFASKLPSPAPTVRGKVPVERCINLLLSDLHLEALIGAHDGLSPYGRKEESRALAAIALQTCEFKPHYRKNTTLKIHILGDIVAGALHDAREGAPMAEQVATAIHLLIQFVSYVSSHFREVEVYCVSGNHGRNKARHDKRAVYQKWDSYETMIYYAVKKGLTVQKNVTVHVPYTPYYVVDIFGQKMFATHGDNVLVVGNPGKTLNISNIQKQIDAWNAQYKNKKDMATLFAVGHIHTPVSFFLPNGTNFLCNGTAMVPGPHSVSSGYFTNQRGQWLWESVPGFILGDSRLISVNEATDKDRSLDKIIKPFDGF